MLEIRSYHHTAHHSKYSLFLSRSEFSNLAIYLQSLKCSVFSFILFDKEKCWYSKKFEHITIKDKNQSSQHDWCKITVTIAKRMHKEKSQSVYVCFILLYGCGNTQNIIAEVALEWNTEEFLYLKCIRIAFAMWNLHSASSALIHEDVVVGSDTLGKSNYTKINMLFHSVKVISIVNNTKYRN